MRLALLTIVATAVGLGACAPVPASPYGYGYGYAPAPAPASYGYYDGAYAPGPAPGPYYAEPGYVPYATPGPAIIVGGERRWDGGDRYRYDRPRDDRAFRGNPNPPNRDYRVAQEPRNFGGNRPGPQPGAQPGPRPGPAPQAIPAPPAGGAAFEQWNRTHVNASPQQNENGPR